MLTVITDAELDMIHETSLGILEDVGVEIPHEETLRRLARAGADVDASRNRARLPRRLIGDALAVCGKHFVLYGRDSGRQARFGFGEMNFNSIAGESQWLEEESLTRRYTVATDVDTAARIGDGLEHINIVGAMASPADVPASVQDVVVLQHLVKNTSKPVTFWFTNRKAAQFVSEVLMTLAGSESSVAERPLTYNFLEPISPLRFPFNGVDLLYETTRFPLPVSIGPMVQAGATGPVTLAGTLALENAEILAGIVIVQSIRRGTPVCYGGIPHIFDMRTTQMVFSGPEQSLMAVAMVQMARRYGLPVYTNTGLTDSKVPDAQAGLECALSLICAVDAGADIFGHLGICGVDQAASLSMLVMQNEVIGYIKRMKQGFRVDAETLALDVIKSVGIGGNFLAEEHTLRHLRSEHWYSKLPDRDFFEVWCHKGRKDMAARCMERRDHLLQTHVPEPLPDDVSREIDRITRAAWCNAG